MKKILALFVVLCVMVMTLTACNYQMIDTTWSYDKAIIQMPDGSVVSGKVSSWKDYEDGDQIQVNIEGNTYLVHSMNVVLIHEK